MELEDHLRASFNRAIGLRGRANTLEKSEQIRPPRRKRRSSHDFSAASSGENNSNSMRPRELRSGSVPPNGLLAQSLPLDAPQPLPRLRRSAGRPRLSCQPVKPASQPCSGHNTPISEIEQGSSALDLSDLTPFGLRRSDSHATSHHHQPHRHSVKHSSSRHKWNWIWSKSGKDSNSDSSNPSKYSGSFLSRKRKSRHISCPDITAVSCDSSRSTSPVSFKVSLTSLFGGSPGTSGVLHGKLPPTQQQSSAIHSVPSFSKHRGCSSSHGGPPTASEAVRGHRDVTSVAVAVKSTSLTVTQPIMSQQRLLNDFATEVVDDLSPLQYCHVSHPYECYMAEQG